MLVIENRVLSLEVVPEYGRVNPAPEGVPQAKFEPSNISDCPEEAPEVLIFTGVTPPFTILLSVTIPSGIDFVLRLYGTDVNSLRGVNSEPPPTVIPNQYCLSKEISKEVTSPKITLKIPSVTDTDCVSIQTAVPPVSD